MLNARPSPNTELSDGKRFSGILCPMHRWSLHRAVPLCTTPSLREAIGVGVMRLLDCVVSDSATRVESLVTEVFRLFMLRNRCHCISRRKSHQRDILSFVRNEHLGGKITLHGNAFGSLLIPLRLLDLAERKYLKPSSFTSPPTESYHSAHWHPRRLSIITF